MCEVKFLDYSEYDSEKCNNGGCYGFRTEYIRISDERLEVTHGTTADLTYCPVCGSLVIIMMAMTVCLIQDIVAVNSAQ